MQNTCKGVEINDLKHLHTRKDARQRTLLHAYSRLSSPWPLLKPFLALLTSSISWQTPLSASFLCLWLCWKHDEIRREFPQASPLHVPVYQCQRLHMGFLTPQWGELSIHALFKDKSHPWFPVSPLAVFHFSLKYFR